MMSQPPPLTIPDRKLTRTVSLSVRLTEPERAAVNALAHQLGVTPSHLARHFLMQSVSYISQHLPPTVPQSDSEHEYRR